MKLFVEMPDHQYNNIMALDAVSLGRTPYKGIIMYSVNAIKHGEKIEPILDRLKSEIKVYSDPQGFICISEKRLDDIFKKCMAGSEPQENERQGMTREERENALHCLKVMIDEEVCEECNLYGTTGTDHCEADSVRVAIKALEQEPILDKIREQFKSNLRGVEIALEVLVENHPLRPKMEGAKDTLEECLELIDKAETEADK